MSTKFIYRQGNHLSVLYVCLYVYMNIHVYLLVFGCLLHIKVQFHSCLTHCAAFLSHNLPWGI